jgi:hypothetical protein
MSPSPANFIDRVFFGYQNTAALKAALELDVFTAIGEGYADVASLADRFSESGLDAFLMGALGTNCLTHSLNGIIQISSMSCRSSSA